MTPRLRVRGVTVRFGPLTALQDVDLEVPARQVVGVIGTNGAGKTTLLDVICGETKPDRGALELDGRRLRARPGRLSRIGIARTVQGLELPEDRSVVDHVLGGVAPAPRTAAAFALQRVSADERRAGSDREHARQLLRELGLAAAADAPIGTLPRAGQVRAMVARAMISNPVLLLLDEPAAGLGPAERRDLAALIRGIATRPGRDCAVVLVEHHVDLIALACDSVVCLEAGVVIASGAPEAVFGDPQVAGVYLP